MIKFNDIVKQAAIDSSSTPLQARAVLTAALQSMRGEPWGSKSWCITGLGQIKVKYKYYRNYRDPRTGEWKIAFNIYKLRQVRTQTQRLRDRPR